MLERSHDPAILRLAWEEALRARGCPPEAVLLADPVPDALRRHLSACPWCEEEREALLRDFPIRTQGHALPESPSVRPAHDAGGTPGLPGKDPCSDKLPGTRPKTSHSYPMTAFEPAALDASGSIRPGDLVRFQPDLAGWGPRDRYYNAPLVLVLEALEETASAFRVALVHDFPDLAGPGDVEIMPGTFAEPWNTFACLRVHLSHSIYKVPESLLNVIRQKARNPSQAVSCDETSTESPLASFLWAFQRLEVEVASFFAQRTLEDSMIFQENPLVWTLACFFRDRKTFWKAFSPWLQLDADTEPSLKTLLTAPWVEEVLPLAAAPAHETFPVRLLRVGGEGTPVLKRASAEITVFEPSPKGFLVGGRILEPLSDAASVQALWVVSGRELEPLETSLDAHTGYFRLLFPTLKKSSPSPQDLRVLVVDR